MTPKEKAEELFMLYIDEGLTQIKPIINRFVRKEMAKQCAIITINEILNAISGMVSEEHGYSADTYYEQVKQEIQAL